jgi:hypothetical protein
VVEVKLASWLVKSCLLLLLRVREGLCEWWYSGLGMEDARPVLIGCRFFGGACILQLKTEVEIGRRGKGGRRKRVKKKMGFYFRYFFRFDSNFFSSIKSISPPFPNSSVGVRYLVSLLQGVRFGMCLWSESYEKRMRAYLSCPAGFELEDMQQLNVILK